MTWTYHESQKDNAEFLRQFIAFLQSCLSQKQPGNEVRPEFVPSKVELPNAIRVNNVSGVFQAGTHIVTSNQWGAMCAVDDTGKMMGILPDECIVLEMCPNPHLKRNQEPSE